VSALTFQIEPLGRYSDSVGQDAVQLQEHFMQHTTVHIRQTKIPALEAER
jgi:hypothetical protein